MNNAYLFTSESVAEGHPDKVADQMRGVDRKDEKLQGAGDQGLMFGDASDETDTLMPAPIAYAHLLVQRQSQVRKSGKLGWLRPDAKSQITFRCVAKNIVAAGLASCCEIPVSYAISVAEPTPITVETFGTGTVSRERLTQPVPVPVPAHFDLTPYGLRAMLDLVRPIYEKTAAYGHFGREEPEFTWESIDRAVALRDAAAPASARRTTKRKAAAPA